MKVIKVGDTAVGEGQPIYLVGEIGINHNSDMEITKKLIKVAVDAGLNAVKFQKRTPELCVPRDQWDVMRDTPWGVMSYIDYRHRMEFGRDDYAVINNYCEELGITWFASCWDEEAVAFMEPMNPVCYKVASASLTDDVLLNAIRETGRLVILSTGMSTMEEIRHAVSLLDIDNLLLCHSTSAYPCDPSELNLNMINTLREEFDCPIGYSGHEVGLATTYAAATLGASLIERHITLDRSMWGSDQSASIEPQGVVRLARDVRIIEQALGDGVKRVYDSEIPIRSRLRRTVAFDES
jgi:sialic acid synthase SpsE